MPDPIHPLHQLKMARRPGWPRLGRQGRFHCRQQQGLRWIGTGHICTAPSRRGQDEPGPGSIKCCQTRKVQRSFIRHRGLQGGEVPQDIVSFKPHSGQVAIRHDGMWAALLTLATFLAKKREKAAFGSSQLRQCRPGLIQGLASGSAMKSVLL